MAQLSSSANPTIVRGWPSCASLANSVHPSPSDMPPLLILRHPTMPFHLLDRHTCGPIALVMQGVSTATGGPVAVSLSSKRHRSRDATILLGATGLEPRLPPHRGARCNRGCPKFPSYITPFSFSLSLSTSADMKDFNLVETSVMRSTRSAGRDYERNPPHGVHVARQASHA